MIFRLKKVLRYILRRILLKEDCVICSSILKIEENSLCRRCLENLKNVSSLKKYQNVYYLWILDENFMKILKASQNRRIFVEDLRQIIVEKLDFILKNENISSLFYRDSEFFISLLNSKTLDQLSTNFNCENNKRLVLKENLNRKLKDKNIYFSLFMSRKLIKMN